MFLPKHPKTAISRISTNFLIKKHFWTHVNLGSCIILEFKDVEKISEFSTM